MSFRVVPFMTTWDHDTFFLHGNKICGGRAVIDATDVTFVDSNLGLVESIIVTSPLIRAVSFDCTDSSWRDVALVIQILFKTGSEVLTS